VYASVKSRPVGESAGAELVAACVQGSPGAWRELYRVYYPVAGAFLRKMGVRDQELDDACQNVFVQMVRYLPGFRGDSSFKTWLYRVCLSEARELRRRSRLREVMSQILRRERDAEPAVGLELSEGSARRRVQAALAQLKPHERSVFILYEMEGLKGEQIAEIVNCPVATVWRRLHYARAQFKQQLELDDGGSS
jgi:RNA polymerase sigma-70 factor (ECF subfamily)